MEYKKICIADDSTTARTIIKQCLEIAGFSESEFLEAANGQQVIEHLNAGEVNLVVTDLNMPVMDGIALLEKIKKGSYKNIPVVIVTSSSNSSLDEKLIHTGAFAVVSKPVSPAKIFEIVEKLKGEQ